MTSTEIQIEHHRNGIMRIVTAAWLFSMLLPLIVQYSLAQGVHPVVGREYTITYNPLERGKFMEAQSLTAVYAFNFWGRRTGTRLALRANVLRPDSQRVNRVELRKTGNVWRANVPIPRNAAVLSYYVTNGEESDMNGDRTFVFHVHDSTGRVVQNAHYFMVPFLKLGGEQLDKMIQEARQETILYPENFRAYYQHYQLRIDWGKGSTGTQAAIANELSELEQTYGTNNDFLNLAARTYYYLFRDTRKGLAYRNRIPHEAMYPEVVLMFDREEAEKRREEIEQRAALVQMSMRDKPAPPFVLDRLDGGTVSLEAFSGKVVLLNFWATWSKPSARQLPRLRELYRELRHRGLEILAISLDTQPDAVRSYLEELDVSIPVAFGSQRHTEVYGVGPIPHTVVIDREGKVKRIYVGYAPGDEDKIRLFVESILRES